MKTNLCSLSDYGLHHQYRFHIDSNDSNLYANFVSFTNIEVFNEIINSATVIIINYKNICEKLLHNIYIYKLFSQLGLIIDF